MAVRLEVVTITETTDSLERATPGVPGAPVLGAVLVVGALVAAAGVYAGLSHAVEIVTFVRTIWAMV